LQKFPFGVFYIFFNDYYQANFNKIPQSLTLSPHGRKGIAQNYFKLIVVLLICSTPFSHGGKGWGWGDFFYIRLIVTFNDYLKIIFYIIIKNIYKIIYHIIILY
jgi:hypothetical protein